ncbi:MAG TPA: ATP-grasp domain-containing protein [Gaiellaceae bacterium]
MRFVVIAHRCTDTNEALAAAAAALGLVAAVQSPRDALRLLEPGDVALGRLDVREGLDGMESGSVELEHLTATGIDVLNRPSALVASHDKLLTARALRLSGLPHPHTWLIAEGMPTPAPELPLVLKPRFGSWGRDVVLCRTAADLDTELERIAYRPWFREQGVLAQELVPPQGWDLRVVVAGGRIVGAARRVAAAGEWRTNVSLGGHSEPVEPPALARTLALAAAAAVRADLVGVDLLPTRTGFVISEINGAVDFRPWYASAGEDVFVDAVLELLRIAHDRRATALLPA